MVPVTSRLSSAGIDRAVVHYSHGTGSHCSDWNVYNSERAEVTVIWMLQPHFIFYCALCLVRTVSHKQRIYRVTINESRAADIPLAHCLSARHSHITAISILHASCPSCCTSISFVVPRRTHVCPSHTLLYPSWVLVAGRTSTTPSAPTERILVMFGSKRTSLRHRCLIQTHMRDVALFLNSWSIVLSLCSLSHMYFMFNLCIGNGGR